MFSGSSPCPNDQSTCYDVQSVSASASSAASVSSSHSWGGSASGTLSVSATVSNRLGPVTMTYTVVVSTYEEQTLSRQVQVGEDYETEYYQDRVHTGDVAMSASVAMLLLPTSVTVQSQPSSSYVAATTTNIEVTLELQPAVQLTSGHSFAAAVDDVTESGAVARIVMFTATHFCFPPGSAISNFQGGAGSCTAVARRSQPLTRSCRRRLRQ